MTQATKVAVVTGAGSGIGKAVATAMLKAGYKVALAGRRQELLEKAVQETGASAAQRARGRDRRRQPGIGARALRADQGGVRPARRAVQQRGRGRAADPLEDLTFEQWKSVVDINLTGVFLCTQEAFRLMKDQTPRGGRIINNGSISAHAPRPNSAPYTATKHAITGLTKSHVARRPQVRHRLRPDRHRQRGDRHDGPDGEGRAAGQRRRSRSSR